MIEGYPYDLHRRNRRHFDWRDIAGPVICGVVVTYVLAAGIAGILAR